MELEVGSNVKEDNWKSVRLGREFAYSLVHHPSSEGRRVPVGSCE